MARPQAFERELKLATAGLEPAAIAGELAAFAKRSLAAAQQAGEAPERYVRIVNGRIGAPEESVIPPGPIIYDFNWLAEVVEYGLAFAAARSPVRSGRYKRAWFAMVNGQRAGNLTEIPGDAEVIITNDVPYARKIEVGHMKMQVPPGIVEDTRQAIMRRFGNIVVVERKFVELAGAYVLRRGRRRGQRLTYPAVLISMRGF